MPVDNRIIKAEKPKRVQSLRSISSTARPRIDILSKRKRSKEPKKPYKIKSVKIKFDRNKEIPVKEQESSESNSMEEEETYYLIKSGMLF